jgi:regulator of protease activity HflC (stomatin/prohibitin superfamily)
MIIVYIGLAVLLLVIIISSMRIVPQKSAFVVERLGKYQSTLTAGLHVLMPFLDRIAYRHTLKEVAVDVESQTCITRDNVAVEVDGILYLKVIDAKRASYGIDNYMFASSQIAQTTMRSIIGKLELDKTFEERDNINAEIVQAVDLASDPWGVKITRYEIKNITPPQSVKEAMEKQMRAEREKRAVIAESEGRKQATVNVAEAAKREIELRSEGQKIKQINEAAGKAAEIRQIAEATAMSIQAIAQEVSQPGGSEAVSLRIAEQYLLEFGKIAKESSTLVIPTDLSDIAGLVASLKKVSKQ